MAAHRGVRSRRCIPETGVRWKASALCKLLNGAKICCGQCFSGSAVTLPVAVYVPQSFTAAQKETA